MADRPLASMPVCYWINVRGLSQIPNGSEFNAVQAAFQTWQDVPTADIQFDYKGTTQCETVGRDGLNLISFADDATPLGSSTLAATFTFFCRSVRLPDSGSRHHFQQEL